MCVCVCAAGVGVCVAFSLSALALLISCQSVAVGSCQVCQLLLLPAEPSPANLMPPAVQLDVCTPSSPCFLHPIHASFVCLFARPPVRLGLANALATNSSNLAQNWRLMTYVWHIAKLGDLMKFIIVLVYIPPIYYGVFCAAALTKASAGRTNGSPQSSVGSESLCPILAATTATLFGPASVLWSIKITN